MTRMLGLGCEKGMILILAVFLIAALSLLGVASTRNVAVDTVVSSSHLSSIQSFYVAEAGLEKGKLEAVRRMNEYDWFSFTPLLDGSSNTVMEVPFNKPVPFGQGGYTVTVLNDPTEAGAKTDLNRSITIRSTGSFGPSISIVETTIQMLTPPRLPGALSVFRDSDFIFEGGTFRISGYDYKTSYQTGSPDGLFAPRPGIALCGTLDSALSASNIRSAAKGIGEVNGTSDITQSNEIASEAIDGYVTSLKSVAVDSVNCSEFNITYVAKDLSVSCSSGRGLLVVEGNLDFSENASWNGLIVVRGGQLHMKGFNYVRGGVVVETWTDSLGNERRASVRIGQKGYITVVNSREALDDITRALTGNHGKWRVLGWRRVR